jgi:hypothetical protein
MTFSELLNEAPAAAAQGILHFNRRGGRERTFQRIVSPFSGLCSMKTVYPGALPRAVTSWAFSPIFLICVYPRPSAVKSALVSGRNQLQGFAR